MMNDDQEFLVNCRVTYTLQLNGKFYLVENVPSRVNEETGEQFFDPSVVKHLQQLILNEEDPVRIIETPVYNYHE
ncbi:MULTISPECIES: hypothetical protein [Microcoleus]|jgi:hypothetical protein|uniref:hypothetical protein n=1 Tax=Microcoleus TaxID=44471 RepID=UPI001686615B|nr:hypothetical protein [Microcoleus sp. FACHB-61]